MSTYRQIIKDSIRKLARTKEEERVLLEATRNRGGLAGASGVGVSEAEESRLCCDGSTSSSGTPGTEERDPDASSQTGLDLDDPARLTAGDGTLSGVTDCATGEPICMDGSGHIPPDGWDEPSDPPLIESYTEGTYWVTDTQTLTNKGPTAEASYEDWLSNPSRPAASNYELRQQDADTYYAFYLVTESIAAYFYRVSCGGSTADYCNPTEDEITADAWPADSCVNLARVGDKLVGSKYDPENDGSYSAPRSSINLCDASNGKSILYQALPGGGFRTIESSGGVAVSGAVGYTYSADGTLTGTITQAEWEATAP